MQDWKKTLCLLAVILWATSSSGAPEAACPSDMVLITSGVFCMDRFEAPNKPGAVPYSCANAFEGEAWCKARGKEMCTESQWLWACEGGNLQRKYPYGNTWEAGFCNDNKTWISPNWTAIAHCPSYCDQQTKSCCAECNKLDQATQSGAFPDCVSIDGVYDMTGNVAEWVRTTPEIPRKYANAMKGCYWSKCYGGSNPSCQFTNPAHPGGFRTYEAGWRCCQNVTTTIAY